MQMLWFYHQRMMKITKTHICPGTHIFLEFTMPMCITWDWNQNPKIWNEWTFSSFVGMDTTQLFDQAGKPSTSFAWASFPEMIDQCLGFWIQTRYYKLSTSYQ